MFYTTFFIGFILWLASSLMPAYGDVPTAKENCNHQNLAICEINGLTYHTPEPCKPPAKTIKPLGNVDCSRADPVQAQSKIQQSPPPIEKSAPIKDWFSIISIIIITMVMVLTWIVFSRRKKIPSLIVSGVALVVSYFIARIAFYAVFTHFSNHETAAPILMAFGAGFIVFLLSFAVLQIVIGKK